MSQGGVSAGVLLLVSCVLALAPSGVLLVHGQLSQPIARDHHVPGVETNKFLQRAAHKDSAPPPPSLDEAPLASHMECAMDLELKWLSEASSSVYATPLIADLRGDGARQVLVPSFVHYLEALEGANGASAHVPGGGWPAYHQASVHASPIKCVRGQRKSPRQTHKRL